MRTLLRNGTIVVMNSLKEIRNNCDLLIQDDRIVELAPGGSSNPTDFDFVLECDGKIIIPGLVSAHSHSTGMFQRGLWDETSFEAWSRKSNAIESRLNFSPEDLYTIHCAAGIEFIRHGVTTVLNMFTASPGSEMEKVQSACNALLQVGLRGILALSLTPHNEASPTDPASPTSLLELARQTAEHVAGLESRLTCMLAPSAPQRCSDSFLLSCKEVADENGLSMHTHLAEAKSHAEAGHRIYGEPIVKHLEKIGFLNSRLSVAHAIWLEEEEIDLLKEFDVKVVHNPACNMKLADGPAQVKKMLQKGLSVGLGPLPRHDLPVHLPVSSRLASASRSKGRVRLVKNIPACDFTKEGFSGLQSFLNVPAPMLARPPDRSCRRGSLPTGQPGCLRHAMKLRSPSATVVSLSV